MFLIEHQPREAPLSSIEHGPNAEALSIQQEHAVLETHASGDTGNVLFNLYVEREYTLGGEFRSLSMHLDRDEAKALRRALDGFIGDDTGLSPTDRVRILAESYLAAAANAQTAISRMIVEEIAGDFLKALDGEDL